MAHDKIKRFIDFLYPVFKYILDKYFQEMPQKIHTIERVEQKLDPLLLIGLNSIFAKELYPDINLCSAKDTLHELMTTTKSFIRFSDCEFYLMDGKTGVFQEDSPELELRLKEVYISAIEKDIMVGVNYHHFGSFDKNFVRKMWHLENKFFSDVIKFAIPKAVYYDASVFRYTPIELPNLLENKSVNALEVFTYRGIIPQKNGEWYRATKEGKYYLDYYINNLIEPLKQLFFQKHVIIIEGEKSFVATDNDLLELAKTVDRIFSPPYNAFTQIDTIREEALDKASLYDKTEVIFILALGATATILAYELDEIGYRALDVGNFSLIYDWVLGISGLEKYTDINDDKVLSRRSSIN